MAGLQAVMSLRDGRTTNGESATLRTEALSKYLRTSLQQLSVSQPAVFRSGRSLQALVAMLKGDKGAASRGQQQTSANAMLACTLLLASFQSVDDWPTVRTVFALQTWVQRIHNQLACKHLLPGRASHFHSIQAICTGPHSSGIFSAYA